MRLVVLLRRRLWLWLQKFVCVSVVVLVFFGSCLVVQMEL